MIYVNGTLLETRKVNTATESGLSMRFVRENGMINGKITAQSSNTVRITVNGQQFAVYTLDFDNQSYSTAYGPDYSLMQGGGSSSSSESSSESSESSSGGED